jgi:hypothetical protein
MITGLSTQDTINTKLVVHIRTDKLLSDSVFKRLDEKPAHILAAERRRLRQNALSASDTIPHDTTSVCLRNTVADATFYDSLTFVRHVKIYPEGTIPFRFSEKSGSQANLYHTELIKNLRDGQALALKPLNHDWITAVIFFAAWLFLVVKQSTRSMWPEITRFLFLRGINEPISRDIGSLFYWQSTIINFISFLVISIFIYCAAAWYDILPTGLPSALTIAIIFGIVAAVITLQHFLCLATGSLSGQTEAFNEYLINIYQSYRFSSFVIFVIILLLVYTVFCPAEVCIIAGISVFVVFYVYRIMRLLLIFIKRNISIFYLILYFCALEILPVLILVKYLAGLR